jgi:hypothetical protein
MITRPVFDKILHQSSSQLLEDFGVVLGEELISDENDRTFSDGDVGNWTLAESGSAASLDYDTSSIGGQDDKQIKITAEAGEDYALARLAFDTYTTALEANTYYIITAKAYLDPNAAQSKVAFYPTSLSDVEIVYANDGEPAGGSPSYATINKGVWEDVYSIFQTGSDLSGYIGVGFFDTGDLTANDIAYFDNISLRKITFSDDWTAGDGWGPKFALTAPSLGDEELSNGDFSSVTEGSDLVTDGDMDVAGSWTIGTGWAIAGSVATFTHGSGDGTLQQDGILTAGHQYRAYYDVTANTFDGDITIDGGTCSDTPAMTVTVDTNHSVDFVANGSAPTHFTISAANGTGGAISIDNVVVKKITPTGWTVTGVDADSYIELDTAADTVRLYTGNGDDITIKQNGILTVGNLYYVAVDMAATTSGVLRVYNASAVAYDKPISGTNLPLQPNSAGVFSMVFEAGSTNLLLYCTSVGDDVTINSISIKPYTPSHANTDPRFDRQTESNVYTSDFSADEDGWTADNGAAADADAVGGEDDTLKYTCDAADGVHRATKLLTTTENTRVKWQLDYYIPSGQSNIDEVGVYDQSSGEWLSVDNTTTDSWTTISGYATVGSGGKYLRIYGLDGGVSSFQDAGGDDYFAIKNVTIEAVTLSDYSGTAWYPYDENGGAVHVAGSSLAMFQNIGSVGEYYLYIYKVSNANASIGALAGSTYGDPSSSSGVFSTVLQASVSGVLGIYCSTSFTGTVDYLYIIPLPSGPAAHCTGSQSAESTLSDTDLLTVGDRYTTAITIANRTGGEVRPTWGNNNGTPISATGSEVGIAYNNQKGGITATDDFVGDVTALTITEAPRSVFRGVFGNR